jgi:hypothetical protein
MLIAYYPAKIGVQLPEAEGEGCKMQILVVVVVPVGGIIVQTAVLRSYANQAIWWEKKE